MDQFPFTAFCHEPRGVSKRGHLQCALWTTEFAATRTDPFIQDRPFPIKGNSSKAERTVFAGLNWFRSSLGSEPNSASSSKSLQSFQLVPDSAARYVLDIVRALSPLPPLFQLPSRDTDNGCCSGFIENRIVVISRYRLAFNNQVIA